MFIKIIHKNLYHWYIRYYLYSITELQDKTYKIGVWYHCEIKEESKKKL